MGICPSPFCVVGTYLASSKAHTTITYLRLRRLILILVIHSAQEFLVSMTGTTTNPARSKTTMQISLDKFIVRFSDGSFDLDSTLTALAPEVVAAVEKQDSEYADIAKAVHAVFDTFAGARLNTAAVVSFAMQHLEVTPATAGDVTTKVQDYIKSNSGERGESLFWTRRGRAGGVKRWCDTPDGEETK